VIRVCLNFEVLPAARGSSKHARDLRWQAVVAVAPATQQRSPSLQQDFLAQPRSTSGSTTSNIRILVSQKMSRHHLRLQPPCRHPQDLSWIILVAVSCFLPSVSSKPTADRVQILSTYMLQAAGIAVRFRCQSCERTCSPNPFRRSCPRQPASSPSAQPPC